MAYRGQRRRDSLPETFDCGLRIADWGLGIRSSEPGNGMGGNGKRTQFRQAARAEARHRLPPNEPNSPGARRLREIRSAKLAIRNKLEMPMTETDQRAPNEPNFLLPGAENEGGAGKRSQLAWSLPAVGDSKHEARNPRQIRDGNDRN